MDDKTKIETIEKYCKWLITKNTARIEKREYISDHMKGLLEGEIIAANSILKILDF